MYSDIQTDFSGPGSSDIPRARSVDSSKRVPFSMVIIVSRLGISEWYSPAKPGTGIHPRPGSATLLRGLIPEIDDSWSSLWYPSRKGEDVDEVHNRTAGFLEVFVPEVERRMPTTHSRILLVAHAATVITLTRELMGDRDLPLRVGCCTLTDLKRKCGAKVLGGWTAKALATGNHLSGGVQRDWGFQDIEISDGKVRFPIIQFTTPNLVVSRSSMIPGLLEPRTMRKAQ